MTVWKPILAYCINAINNGHYLDGEKKNIEDASFRPVVGIHIFIVIPS
jgi:hypothetical protein